MFDGGSSTVTDPLSLSEKTSAQQETHFDTTQRPTPQNEPFSDSVQVTNSLMENEGWCRNKKYIVRDQNGFSCSKCNKRYDCYKSASYHVTIYHRDPPIKCDEPGCQFTSREAIDVHFHKYHRHHAALPDSNNLGACKCPFCEHTSISSVSLEEHIKRHMPEYNGSGSTYECPQCPVRSNSQRTMYGHMLIHSDGKKYPRDQCVYEITSDEGNTEADVDAEPIAALDICDSTSSSSN